MRPIHFHAEHAWLPDGFAAGVDFAAGASDDGACVLQSARIGAPRGESTPLGRIVVPGMPNLHSHAFQRAMA
ncbi:MAG TPA: formimidoylglutamate deiminase, partial [Dokdonella sp.]|nr:formimidoylglutamate deiminase [Dokdonella sp.]